MFKNIEKKLKEKEDCWRFILALWFPLSWSYIEPHEPPNTPQVLEVWGNLDSHDNGIVKLQSLVSNNFWYCYGNASMMIATKKIKKRRRWASPLFLLNTKNTQCLVGVWSYNDDGGGGNNSYHWCCGCYEFPHPCQVKWERKRAQQEKKKKKDKGPCGKGKSLFFAIFLSFTQ